MIGQGSPDAEICVIGRCDFRTGIGSMTYSLVEMLARSFPVRICPTEPALRQQPSVQMPNGRQVLVCDDPSRMKVNLFCDVLWNGEHDLNYQLVPTTGLRIAYIVFDSSHLPERWVRILNECFDATLVTSPHLMATALRSGVRRPVGSLPIALDLGALLAHPWPRAQAGGRLRFGCVAAFHPRKGIETLVAAFLSLYAGRDDVELVLHSNISIGSTVEFVRAQIAASGAGNVRVSHESLDEAGKNALIRSFSVFVNCSQGEAYSVGPREALALGLPLVLSDVGGHQDLAGVPGVFMVAPTVKVPARYPEIDNLVSGTQMRVEMAPVAEALRAAHDFVQSEACAATRHERRALAAEFGFDRLTVATARILDVSAYLYRPRAPRPAACILPDEYLELIRTRLGAHAEALRATSRHVLPAHDGGFFSVFNAWFSHLVWDQREWRIQATFPDWDVDRLLARLGRAELTSFCYGVPGGGNVWLSVFEPMFGYDDAAFDDAAVLHGPKVHRPDFVHNEDREPLMTYIHAYELYRSADFPAWRRQYHAVFADHVRLRPKLRAELDAFLARHFHGRQMLGAHVRHPSHTVEQPGALIAHADGYIASLRAQIAARGLHEDDPGWGVFLATDQDKVVARFAAEFGDRLACFDDVRRTRAEEDAAFEALPEQARNADGHQLQHVVAADPAQWSARMAWEVVRDAYAMASCVSLLHVVSNVSTAVSYMNPELEMIFCDPAAAVAVPAAVEAVHG